MKNAFSMIELVFVIVVLGILAAIAIPKFAATRDDAQIAKARSTIASVRSAIVSERQSRLITGDSDYITKLHSSTIKFFDGNGTSELLMYGVVPQDANGHWHTAAASGSDWTYKYKMNNIDVLFAYTPSDGKFDCNTTDTTYGETCKLLVN